MSLESYYRRLTERVRTHTEPKSSAVSLLHLYILGEDKRGITLRSKVPLCDVQDKAWRGLSAGKLIWSDKKGLGAPQAGVICSKCKWRQEELTP